MSDYLWYWYPKIETQNISRKGPASQYMYVQEKDLQFLVSGDP